MGRLDGKCVLVTGASRGIGAEIARLFAGEGGRVVCAARTLREGEHPLAGSLETTVAGIRATGGTAEAVTANIAEPAECERLVARAREIYGPVDVLVNNAALTYYVQVKDYPINKWMRSWAVNFHGSRSAAAPSSTSPLARPSDPAVGPILIPHPALAAAPATERRKRLSSASRKVSPPRSISTASPCPRWRLLRWCRRRAPCITASSRRWTIRAGSRRSSWPRPLSCSPRSLSTRSRAASPTVSRSSASSGGSRLRAGAASTRAGAATRKSRSRRREGGAADRHIFRPRHHWHASCWLFPRAEDRLRWEASHGIKDNPSTDLGERHRAAAWARRRCAVAWPAASRVRRDGASGNGAASPSRAPAALSRGVGPPRQQADGPRRASPRRTRRHCGAGHGRRRVRADDR